MFEIIILTAVEDGDEVFPVEALVVDHGHNSVEFRRMIMAPCGHINCTAHQYQERGLPILSYHLN